MDLCNSSNDKKMFHIRAARSEDVASIYELIKALAEYEKLSHAVVGDIDTHELHTCRLRLSRWFLSPHREKLPKSSTICRNLGRASLSEIKDASS